MYGHPASHIPPKPPLSTPPSRYHPLHPFPASSCIPSRPTRHPPAFPSPTFYCFLSYPPCSQPCNPRLPPLSAPPSILPPCSSLLLLPSISLSLSLSFHPSPRLSASLSPGSSCRGVVLLAERGRRRHTDGSTDGQQAAQGGQAHLLHTHLHTHTNTHAHTHKRTCTSTLIQSPTLPPRHTACLPGTVIQGHKHKYTLTHMHAYIHTLICTSIHTYKHLCIRRFVHTYMQTVFLILT